LLLASFVLVVGCGSEEVTLDAGHDAGGPIRDAGPDAGRVDAGFGDAALVDAALDGGGSDAGAADAAADAGVLDVGADASVDAGPDAAVGEPAEIVRDELGVPHIYADSMRAAFHALGYATAQDRLFQMTIARLIMQGRSAEHFAVAAAAPSLAAKQAFNDRLIKQDLEVQLFDYAGRADVRATELPGDIPELLTAYAAGINAYLASPGLTLDARFQNLGITNIEPWTAGHTLLVWDRMGRVAGAPIVQSELDLFNACSSGSCPNNTFCPGGAPLPLDEGAATVPVPAGAWPPTYPPGFAMSAPPLTERFPSEPVLKASHAWAVRGTHTTSGKPVLAAEPQLGLIGTAHWYQFHLNVPSANVNVRGMGVAGAPGVFVYYNPYTSHTIVAGSGDTTDLLHLQNGANADEYVVDGQTRSVTSGTVTIAIRGQASRTVTVERTVLGPVWNPLLTSVPAGQRFVLRHAEYFRPATHSIVAGIELMRSTSLSTYRQAIAHWVVPTVYAVYAGVNEGAPSDDPGHIAFHALTMIPDRVQQIVDGSDATGRYPIDASLSSNDWQGGLDLNWNPHVIDPPSGYIFNGNSSPAGSWYANTLYSGIGGVGDSYRSLALRYRLAELFSSAGNGLLTPAEIHGLHFDDSAEPLRLFHELLVYLEARGQVTVLPSLDTAPETASEKAGHVMRALELWLQDGAKLDRTDRSSLLGQTLMSQMGQKARVQANQEFGCRWNGGEGGASHFLKALDQSTGILGLPEVTWALEVSEAAWDAHLVANPSLAVNPDTWPAFGRYVFVVPYEMPFFCASWDTCSLDPALDGQISVVNGFTATINSAHGSSFPMTANFADLESSRALQPLGISDDPASLHFDDASSIIEDKSRGVDTLPVAPLDRSLITATSTTQLLYVP
jgi:penicillin amidase